MAKNIVRAMGGYEESPAHERTESPSFERKEDKKMAKRNPFGDKAMKTPKAPKGRKV